MAEDRTLLLTDVVDSTLLNERLGDAVMARLWAEHDQIARGLIRQWRGREVGRSDGFLLLFPVASDALGFALAYHAGLAGLQPPLRARVGLHTGGVVLRDNRVEDVAQGATPFEIDGVALPLAARVMSAALGGQTLMTAATLQALGPQSQRVLSHGHWRLKGVSDAIELFEIGSASAPFVPPPDSAKAYRVVRRHSSWVTLGELPNKLPAERDLFIGRQTALAAISRAFDEGARLITLLGLGGIGKTRLSLHHARCWLGDYPGGAWFCDLDAARGIDGIVHAVASGLDTPLGKGDAVQQLGAAIAGRGPCLVILDNFEQVARHAEATLGAWLERAPEARFIATSREVLGIVGEQTLVLAPMAAEEAAQLFRQRLKAAGQTSELPAEDEAAIPALMELLDQLPLAIELAAARTRVMPPHVLLQRMGERFKVLAARGGRRDRQATMRATLDWSWDLLSGVERGVLAQLSVFEGGFELQSAEAVVDPGTLAGEWLPDLLQALTEKSLLRRHSSGRFDMLRTVHDYAAERLQGHEAGAAEMRHWEHFAKMSELQASGQRLADVDNLVLACRRAAAADPAAAVQLLLIAWAALRLTGPLTAALDLCRLVASSLSSDAKLHALVDRVTGAVLWLVGDVDGARKACDAAISAARRCGDDNTLAQAQCLLAYLELARGDNAAAHELLLNAERSPSLIDDPAVRYLWLNGMGKLRLQQSRAAESRSHYSAALELAQRVGNLRWEAGTQGNLAMIARAEGRREDALRHWQVGVQGADEVGDRQWAGNMRCNLGLLLYELGNVEQARTELQTALRIARAIGHRTLEATALCNLGLVADALGDGDAACDYQLQAADVAGAIGSALLEGQARGYLGMALAFRGQHAQASEQIARSRALLQQPGESSSMALSLLQAAAVSAAGGEVDRARAEWAAAGELVQRLPEGPDPEVSVLWSRVAALVQKAEPSPTGAP